jgi:putative sterol carrier protein
VGVQFLSTEWSEQVKAALNASDSFAQSSAGKKATIQQVIDRNGEQTRYWIVIADGTIDMGIGDAEAPDATITESYETAVGLAKREVNVVTAFMTGKIKVDGNMGLLLGLQGALMELPNAMATIDVDY